jgi:hypothetical protein
MRNGLFERSVIFSILKRADHRFSGEAMANSIATGLLFAFLCNRPGAFARIAAVGIDLLKRGHGELSCCVERTSIVERSLRMSGAH